MKRQPNHSDNRPNPVKRFHFTRCRESPHFSSRFSLAPLLSPTLDPFCSPTSLYFLWVSLLLPSCPPPPFFSPQVRTRTTFGLRYGRWWRNRTWLIFLVRVINGSPISGDRETPARSCWGWTASAKPSPSKSTPTNPRRRRGFSPCSLIRRSVCRLICCWVFFPAISVQKRRSISSHSFPPSLCIWRPWSFLAFSSLVALAVVRFSFLQLRRSEK